MALERSDQSMGASVPAVGEAWRGVPPVKLSWYGDTDDGDDGAALQKKKVERNRKGRKR